jgi:uncharacterized protein
MSVPARLGIVTLGVRDLGRSVAFYERLGWKRASSSVEGEIYWFDLGGTNLGLFGRDALAADAKLPPKDGDGFGGVTLAINLPSEQAVTEALDAAAQAGATIVKPAEKMDWGGFSGYFTDPDGYPWEVAYNPHFPLDAGGLPRIP